MKALFGGVNANGNLGLSVTDGTSAGMTALRNWWDQLETALGPLGEQLRKDLHELLDPVSHELLDPVNTASNSTAANPPPTITDLLQQALHIPFIGGTSANSSVSAPNLVDMLINPNQITGFMSLFGSLQQEPSLGTLQFPPLQEQGPLHFPVLGSSAALLLGQTIASFGASASTANPIVPTLLNDSRSEPLFAPNSHFHS